MSRALVITVVAGVLASFAMVGVHADVTSPRPRVAPQAVQKGRLITVNGEAEVKVVPDEVILTIGVDKSGPDLDRCKGETDAAVKRALEIAAEFGIEPKRIQTSHFNIWACDVCDSMPREKYHVSRTIVITVRDLSKMEDLVAATLKAGLN